MKGYREIWSMCSRNTRNKVGKLSEGKIRDWNICERQRKYNCGLDDGKSVYILR